MWTWIRKNVFRIYRGGKHRTDGPSSTELAAIAAQKRVEATKPRYQGPIDKAAVIAAIKSPAVRVPFVTETERARAISAGRVSTATKTEISVPVIPGNFQAVPDYVPRHPDMDETRITPEDWTDTTSTW